MITYSVVGAWVRCFVDDLKIAGEPKGLLVNRQTRLHQLLVMYYFRPDVLHSIQATVA